MIIRRQWIKEVSMTDKEVLDKLREMYITEAIKVRKCKLIKEKADARRAMKILDEIIDWIERVEE